MKNNKTSNGGNLPLCPSAVVLALLLGIRAGYPAPFALHGPGVRMGDFRITTFATNLNYPLGMARLADGSLLVALSDGTSFWQSTGKLIRLTDADQDGIADGPGTVLYSGLPGGQTSLRIGGSLVFVTGQGQGRPISILRAGPTPVAALSLVGQINLNYAGSWYHPHSALAIRPTPGQAASYDLFFQLGSQFNFAPTTGTVSISSTNIAGASGTLFGDSIYRLTIIDRGNSVTASNLTRIANGLRNPAGFAFHPKSGDLYFEDNGIDGLVDANEPLSADELNVIPVADIGGAVEFFGFPTNYTEYRTGRIVGGAGIQPLVAFQPLPNPLTGEESEGPCDVAFAPPGFPTGLNNGIFVGFHGRFNLGGLSNEENSLAYVDLTATNYFHFIGADEPNIGHLDGLLTTGDSLFMADIASNGDLNTGGGRGVIYQIKSLHLPPLGLKWLGQRAQLTWNYGILQSADNATGPWNDVPDATSPYLVEVDHSPKFFRVRN
ncbi:MAG: hypothetical protein DME25_14110 [Verrucomicrobia bacterium]|nr:MAG: hypothetical protein DME25_14110 [Verrucomicrobiota bacterium]